MLRDVKQDTTLGPLGRLASVMANVQLTYIVYRMVV